MTKASLPLADAVHLEAVKLLPRNVAGAIRLLDVARRRLSRHGWRAEAIDVAHAALSIANHAQRSKDSLRILRWLVKHSPTSDSFLMLGDSLWTCGHPRTARSSWTQAVSIAKRERRQNMIERAQKRLSGIVATDDEVAIMDTSMMALAQKSPLVAASRILDRSRRYERRRDWHEFASHARVALALMERANEIGAARRLARRLTTTRRPATRDWLLLARLELACDDRPRARKAALVAKRRANAEGALSIFLEATEILRKLSLCDPVRGR